MKILPFILTTKHASLEMTALKLFLAHGGKSLWKTEDEVTSQQLEHEYLLPNGLVPKSIYLKGATFFVEIDTEKTKISDFYTWEEALQQSSRPECWRTFYFFRDETNAEWFTSRQLQGENQIEGRPIHEYYEEILERTS